MKNRLVVSFVHGYQNLDINLPEANRPALWYVEDSGETECLSYPFPRNPDDFNEMNGLINGVKPFNNSKNFRRLPRFGFTGIGTCDGYIYAGSWNAVYKIGIDDFKLKTIISNNLMNDLHGIHVDEEHIITVLTGKDTVVINNHQGEIIDHFTIQRDLSVVKDKSIETVDWRFLSKQFRGSTGYWHFNYVQKIGDEIWLTTRNANAFIVIEIETMKARLSLMNLCTPALVHDGLFYNGKFYFTSIDGKIIIAEDSRKSNMIVRETVDDIKLYNRDLVSKIIRINETDFRREPNWCRGIACDNGTIYVTVDGRYDTDLSFGLLAMDEESNKILDQRRLRWSEVGNEDHIRFVTGFDIAIL